MPAGSELYVARLTSRAGDPESRLIEYLEGLASTLAQFDTLALAAVAFACTGSSYLIRPDRATQIVAEAERLIKAPLELGVAAIHRALEHLNARRVFLISPYPEWLEAAAIDYWRRAGISVVGSARVGTPPSDTRAIYELASADAAAALAAVDCTGADAVLLSGTGMPSLRLLRRRQGAQPPVISTNQCLAWRLCHFVAGWSPRPGVLLIPRLR